MNSESTIHLHFNQVSYLDLILTVNDVLVMSHIGVRIRWNRWAIRDQHFLHLHITAFRWSL